MFGGFFGGGGVPFPCTGLTARVCVSLLSGADPLLPLLPALGQGPVHRRLPRLQQPVLLHAHTGSAHRRLMARQVQVSARPPSAPDSLTSGFFYLYDISFCQYIHHFGISAPLISELCLRPVPLPISGAESLHAGDLVA